MRDSCLDAIWSDPCWYLHGLDQTPADPLGVARFVRLKPEDFEQHYWTLRHDEPPPARERLAVNLTELLAQGPDIAPIGPHYYVFHSAFCGSTLLARALSSDLKTFTLFEPRVLQDLRRRPQRPPSLQRAAIKAVGALLGRVPASARTSVIKVHSACNSLMPVLVAGMAEPRGLFLHQDLPSFLAQVLKSPDRRAQVRASQLRGELPLRRFVARPPKPMEDMTPAEAAATTWLHSIHHYLDLVRLHGLETVRSLDSDDLFAHPVATVRAILRHAGASEPEDEAHLDQRIQTAFQHHSKDPERCFGEAERLAEKAHTAAQYAVEIQEGLAWARSLTTSSPIPTALPLPLLPRVGGGTPRPLLPLFA